MATVTYTFEPGDSVYVLIPGNCPATYSVKAAVVSRVEIKINQSTPTDIVTISDVVTLTEDSSVRTINETDVFVDEPSAVTEAMTRYSSNFS